MEWPEKRVGHPQPGMSHENTPWQHGNGDKKRTRAIRAGCVVHDSGWEGASQRKRWSAVPTRKKKRLDSTSKPGFTGLKVCASGRDDLDF